MSERVEVRKWLRQNGYNDIADLIDEVENEWRAKGKKTRRNWWVILAGNSKGQSRVVSGRKFPVLRTMQKRQGCTLTENALFREEQESNPMVWEKNRWTSKQHSIPER